MEKDKIVKEIRSVRLNDIQISKGVLTINNSNVYKLENDTITRNVSAIAYHIKQFNIINDGDKIIIKIKEECEISIGLFDSLIRLIK